MLRSMRRSTRILALLLAPIAAAALAGCGSSSDDDDRGELLVSAATSLKSAFTNYGRQFEDADAQFSFAGSDELAAQIRTGAKPDVFASANTKLPDELFKEGLVERPRVFASNRLVLAVPARDAKVKSIDDLTKKGVVIAIGAEGVPIGAYTRKVLDRLDATTRKAILANVRSNEPDVGGISAKLGQGAADAGFLYVTDVDGHERPAEGDRARRGPAARGQLRRRDRQGHAASQGRAGVRRRADGGRRRCTRSSRPASGCRGSRSSGSGDGARPRRSHRRARGYRDPMSGAGPSSPGQ